jgi:hypothetical protein
VKPVNTIIQKKYLSNVKEQSYHREDARLHSKKSFIRRSTSGEDADSPGSSPSFSSLSPYLLLLSSRATEPSYYSHLEWDGMRWCIYKWGRGPIYSLRWSRGYCSATSAIRVFIILHPWIQPTLNSHKSTYHVAPSVFPCMCPKERRWSHWGASGGVVRAPAVDIS